MKPKKLSYQPHFTKPEDLERIEKLMEKHRTTNVREAISLELAECEQEPDSSEAQWLAQQAQLLDNAAKDVAVKLDRLKSAFKNDLDDRPSVYVAALCAFVAQVGKAYPELYEGMDMVETYIVASNI